VVVILRELLERAEVQVYLLLAVDGTGTGGRSNTWSRGRCRDWGGSGRCLTAERLLGNFEFWGTRRQWLDGLTFFWS
jgi:hypothetical protein